MKTMLRVCIGYCQNKVFGCYQGMEQKECSRCPNEGTDCLPKGSADISHSFCPECLDRILEAKRRERDERSGII
ncbi:MAG TPA: hypothetical protein ENJ27_00735 [Candidatus Moranbacteria bacterium]|nr:hypothetical protein [Candidatus Moranbacteria bacterium]